MSFLNDIIMLVNDMFTGDYNFFDYKYNITGYSGQDFGSFPQYLYLILSLIIIVVLLIVLRKSKKDSIKKILRVVGIFMIVFYLSKTTWESYYDIKQGGGFNWYLLPLDTCSIIMWASVIAGFCKGKIKDYAASWLATGCIVGGIANMLFLNAFKYYPFLSFGAFYSMIWHLIMVLLGFILIVTNYVDMSYKTIIKGFIFHLVISLVVIPINYIFNFDFMLYKDLGGVPIFEGIATNLTNNHLGWINPIMMLGLYFIAFNIIFLIPMGIKKLIHRKTK